MRRLLIPLTLVAPWLLFMACGNNSTAGAGGSTSATVSSSGSGIGGGSTATVADYCNATVEPFCQAYFACCTDPMDREWLGGTMASCKKLFGWGGNGCLLGNPEVYAQAIEAGHTRFDKPSLDACVAHLKAMAAGGSACVEAPHHYLNSICSQIVFQGQLSIGETCIGVPVPGVVQANTSECKHGYCEPKTRTCQPLAQRGEPCANGDNPDCENGEYLRCSEKPDAGISCLYLGDFGEPCAAETECRSSNCDMTSGTCGLPNAYYVCGGE